MVQLHEIMNSIQVMVVEQGENIGKSIPEAAMLVTYLYR